MKFTGTFPINSLLKFQDTSFTLTIPLLSSHKRTEELRRLVRNALYTTIESKKLLSVKGKVVPVLNQLSTTPWRRMRESIYGRVLDLGTSCRWVVSFTPQPLYPRYSLDGRLVGTQSRSGRHGEVIILAPPGLELRPLGRPARSQSLYRLNYRGS
jgi:hypothetical protein